MKHLFPSPAGVFFISSPFGSGPLVLNLAVSVPCRGLFYFISNWSIINCAWIENCFRPLPGSFLFHPIKTSDTDVRGVFPSPAGVFFISSLNKKEVLKRLHTFPSPAGVFFISSLWDSMQEAKAGKSFRPLPGSFLFHLKYAKSQVLPLSFRPLPGSFLFHLYTMARNTRSIKLVSVPCRGLFYFIM